MSPAPANVHNPTLDKKPPNHTLLPRAPAKENPHPAPDIPIHNLLQNLRPAAIQRRDAVDIEDDVPRMALIPAPRESSRTRRRRRAVKLEAGQAALQIARVDEGQGFGDLDDEAAVDELDVAGRGFGVVEFGGGAGDFAEDLDAGFGGVADDGEEGEADAEGDAEGEGVEDCGEEDEGHEEELRDGAEAEEEGDVVRGFFDEGVGDYGDHGGED
ncbi:MAG: hypothetical protein Q9196_007206 [Gyalolechia fulgens]